MSPNRGTAMTKLQQIQWMNSLLMVKCKAESDLELESLTRSDSARMRLSSSNLAAWLPAISDRHLHFSQQSQYAVGDVFFSLHTQPLSNSSLRSDSFVFSSVAYSKSGSYDTSRCCSLCCLDCGLQTLTAYNSTTIPHRPTGSHSRQSIATIHVQLLLPEVPKIVSWYLLTSVLGKVAITHICIRSEDKLTTISS